MSLNPLDIDHIETIKTALVIEPGKTYAIEVANERVTAEQLAAARERFEAATQATCVFLVGMRLVRENPDSPADLCTCGHAHAWHENNDGVCNTKVLDMDGGHMCPCPGYVRDPRSQVRA